MERSFGHDFAKVRVHDDSSAHDAARTFGAAAFTERSDIFLAEGQSAADETAGHYLLAHELAHVVQNERAGLPPDHSSNRLLSAPGDAFETEASRAALTVMAGGTATVDAAPGAVIARSVGTPEIPAWLETIRRNAIGDVGTSPPVTWTGPHADYKVNKAGGLTIDESQGIGVKSDVGQIDTLSHQGQWGAWEEGDSTRYGFKENLAMAKASLNEDYIGQLVGDPTLVVGADIGLGTANAEASLNPDTGLALGAQYNVIEGSISGGTKDTKSDIDEWARFGMSLGGGAGVRAHWGDEDKDGTRSYGFGADIGPFSFDVKSEDPMRTAMRLGGGAGIVPMLPKDNLTNAMGDALGAYSDQVSNVVQQIPSLPTGVIPGLDAVKALGIPDISLPSFADILSFW
jgi:hypothetical protein